MNLSRFLPAFFLIPFVSLNFVAAAPPTVTSIFPAGGQRGTTVTVTAAGTFATWPVQIHLDRSGLKAECTKNKGEFTVEIAADAAPGVYWIRLFDAEGAALARPFEVGGLAEVLEDEKTKTTQRLELPTTANGRLSKSGEVDQFEVKLQAGQTLVASVAAFTTFGSPMDAALQITSAAGFVLDMNDDTRDLDPQLAFTAPTAGDYRLRLFAFPANPNSSVSFAGGADYVYRLTCTTGSFVDHPFPLAVQREAAAPLQLRGWNLAEGETAEMKPNEQDQFDLWKATWANRTPVAVTSSPVVVEQEPNSLDQPQPLAIPSVVCGVVSQPRDEDVFEFTATKGQRISFRLEARSRHSPLDAELLLLDAAGKSLARVDDQGTNRDPQTVLRTPVDGKYRLVVRDLTEQGGWRYVYLVHAELSQPDFTVTVAAESFTVTPGKPLEIPVTINRLEGFAEDVILEAVGLPAGVTAEPVTSPGKGTTAKSVKLVLQSSGPAAQVEFQLVGRSTSSLFRPATAPRVAADQRTSQLWLTVLAK